MQTFITAQIAHYTEKIEKKDASPVIYLRKKLQKKDLVPLNCELAERRESRCCPVNVEIYSKAAIRGVTTGRNHARRKAVLYRHYTLTGVGFLCY